MSQYSDDKYFYLSFVGDYFQRNNKLEDFDSHILKFDWDGNLIETYYSPEYIYSLYKSDKSDVFYGRGFKKGEMVLWKLTI